MSTDNPSERAPQDQSPYGGEQPPRDHARPPQHEAQPPHHPEDRSTGQQGPYGQAPQYGPPPPHQYGQAPAGGPPPPAGYAAAPQYGYQPGAISPSEARTWSLFAHLATLLLGFIAPLVIYLIYKDRDPFIRRHSARSLNFQIILMIAMVINVILIFVLIGIFTMIATGIAALILIILASIAANKGEDYKYPLTPDWVK